MKTNEFLSILKNNPNKSLLFEYKPGAFVGANYHITEVKNVTVDAVDCGANTDFWKETIIQLYEKAEEKDNRTYMSSYKALSILNKVDKIKPMERDVEVKFEYSNANFHTAQLYVNSYQVTGENLVFQLGIAPTDCKAKETCGIEEPAKATAEACAPGSGCC